MADEAKLRIILEEETPPEKTPPPPSGGPRDIPSARSQAILMGQESPWPASVLWSQQMQMSPAAQIAAMQAYQTGRANPPPPPGPGQGFGNFSGGPIPVTIVSPLPLPVWEQGARMGGAAGEGGAGAGAGIPAAAAVGGAAWGDVWMHVPGRGLRLRDPLTGRPLATRATMRAREKERLARSDAANVVDAEEVDLDTGGDPLGTHGTPDPNKDFVENQMMMAARSMRLLALGQMLGATGMPGANIAHSALGIAAMRNEVARERAAAVKKLSEDAGWTKKTADQQEEELQKQPGVVGAGVQAAMSVVGLITSIVAAVDSGIRRITSAIAESYQAQTAVMVGLLREEGQIMGLNVMGQARARIETSRAAIAFERADPGARFVEGIPIVGSILNAVRESEFRGRERRLAAEAETINQAQSAQEQFRQFAQFNPDLAVQSAMQDVGRLYRTMDQARSIGPGYGAFSARYFRHEEDMNTLFARMMPEMFGSLGDRFEEVIRGQIDDFIQQNDPRLNQLWRQLGVAAYFNPEYRERQELLRRRSNEILEEIRGEIGGANAEERARRVTNEMLGQMALMRTRDELAAGGLVAARGEAALGAAVGAGVRAPVLDIP